MILHDTLRVTDPGAARALRQHHAFLGLFMQLQSPSDVAGSAGMAANLAHHHARKLATLGLLHEQRRESGKVYYQLSAREFRVPSDLIPPPDEANSGAADLRGLSTGFLKAYEQSWAYLHTGEEDSYGFGTPSQLPPEPTPPDHRNPQAHPAHLDHLTLRLSPERYQRLARALSAVLAKAFAEGHSPSGQPCTLAVLTFHASDADQRSLSRTVNSFLSAE